MIDFMPKISIVIPVYNGANYLGEAIDSALSQTYENTEVIVINDGSDDFGATDRIAKSYGDRIRYFTKENGGVSTALNLGISVMEGEYFSWLSHDDVYFPKKIETQIAFLQRLDHDVILYSNYQFIDENSQYLRTKKIPDIPSTCFRKAIICQSQLIHGCTLLISRRFLLAVGLFDEDLQTIQDYDMWLRLAECFDFVHVPGVLVSARVHADQGMRLKRNLCQKEWTPFYSEQLNQIFNEWDNCGSIESLAEFSMKSAIKMQRFGLECPMEMCRDVVKKTWYKELMKFNPRTYYWIGYYFLFRMKWLFLK